ncbi:hypothetical protein LQZ21_07765 [Treponema sp. TIM-1]|uniref:hypothetical protein n=1 Tax=Treponema sp. TIM-1 TaxID=2898417 RepID=UPI003980BE76
MKKKLLYGMIALLSVSLFFIGCPTEADDGGAPGSPFDDSGGKRPSPGESAKALAATLTSLGIPVVDAGNGKLRISNATTITQPFAVPSGVELTVVTGTTISAPVTVGSGATLVVPSGTITVQDGTGTQGTITNAGTIEVQSGGNLNVAATGTLNNTGTIEVQGSGTLTGAADGTINNTGAIAVAGTYTLATDVEGTNNGTVTVASTGTVSAASGVRIAGTGINIVDAGGTVIADDISSPSLIGTSGSTFQLSTTAPVGKFSYGNGFFAVEQGNVTLAEDYELRPNLTLTVKAGKLIIDSGDTLTLKNSTADNPVLRGVAGAQVEITGTISFDPSTIVNFYDRLTGAVVGSVTGTYTWTNDVGGANAGKAGWQEY